MDLKYDIETNLEIREKGVYCVNIIISNGLFSDHIPCGIKVCYANLIRLLQNNEILNQVLLKDSGGSLRSLVCPENRTHFEMSP